MMKTNLRAEFPHLCRIEIQKLGEYMERRIVNAKFAPDTSIVTHRKLTEPERQRLLGYIDGMNEANLWADDDANDEAEAQVPA